MANTTTKVRSASTTNLKSSGGLNDAEYTAIKIAATLAGTSAVKFLADCARASSQFKEAMALVEKRK